MEVATIMPTRLCERVSEVSGARHGLSLSAFPRDCLYPPNKCTRATRVQISVVMTELPFERANAVGGSPRASVRSASR